MQRRCLGEPFGLRLPSTLPELLVTAQPRRFSDTAALLFGEALPQPTVVALWDSATVAGATS